MNIFEKVILLFGLIIMCLVVYMTTETMTGFSAENIKKVLPEVTND